jgi:transketolase
LRGHILDALRRRMSDDPTLFFLTGDMGINLVEPIEEAFPDRFLNVGIAEQNLIGVAAGLCNAGFRPVVYTISNFLVHRCFEQLRDDIALHQYPVILLGTSAGFDNAPLGPTHHIIDDWGAIRSFPGLDVYAPACVEFATTVLERVLTAGRPAYIRVAKGTPRIPAAQEDVCYLPGSTSGPLLVSYGSLANECLKVQMVCDDVSVLVLNRVHPLASAAIAPCLHTHPQILVVEDHFAHTGLYGALCQLAMQERIGSFIESLAVPCEYNLTVGQTSEFYHRLYGLDMEGILQRIAVVRHSQRQVVNGYS